MITWKEYVRLGDTAIMVPAAAAIAAWLIAAGVPRMALWWCLLFGVGFSAVIASKIAFAGWGIGLPAIDFFTLSGHAMRTTAVLPVMFFLLLQRCPATGRAFGVLTGLVAGLIMGVCLAAFGFHSVSEAAAGYLVGCLVSLGFIRASGGEPLHCPNRRIPLWSLLIFFAVWYVKPASLTPWMTELALYFSGRDRPYSRATWEISH